MGLFDAFKKIGSKVLKTSVGVANMPWLVDTIARKIPGYEAARNAYMPDYMKKAADAMHNLGALKLGGGVTKAVSVGKAAAKAQLAAGVPAGGVQGVNMPQLKAGANLKAGQLASEMVVKTAQAAAKDPRAKQFMQVLRTVDAAKRGNINAKRAIAAHVRKNVAVIIREGSRPGAPPELKQAAKLTAAAIKATAARKKASRSYGVDRRTARIVRVG
jgi:hypothetical protein